MAVHNHQFVSTIAGFLAVFVLLAGNMTGYCKNGKNTDTSPARHQDTSKELVLTFTAMECTNCAGFSRAIYSEAFSRLGYTVKLFAFPSERALIESNSGRVDGEAARILLDTALAQKYNNLIRVPEMIGQVAIAAYSLDSTVRLTNWNDIQSKNLRVGYIRGSKVSETRLKKSVKPELLVELTDLNQGFELLQRSRIDVLIGLNISVAETVLQPAFRALKVYNAGILQRYEVFPYLHRKHLDLVPKLADVLRDMKNDGTFTRIYNTYWKIPAADH